MAPLRRHQLASPPPAPEDGGAHPPNWHELAAYKGPTSHLERERYFDKLGEESHDDERR